MVYEPAARPLKIPLAWNVIPSFEYVYGDVPPAAATVILPVLLPKHKIFVCDAIDELNADAGCVIVTARVVVQPLLSFTVMVYEPAASPLKVDLKCIVMPSFEYVYGDVPPAADTVILPVLLPKHKTFVCDAI